MDSTGNRAAEPSPAERVRSVLEAAPSLTVLANSQQHDLFGPDLIGFGGDGIRLRTPADIRLVRETEHAAGPGMPVLLQWTDIAPLAVRQRVRGQIRITGWLCPTGAATADGTAVLLLEPRQVALDTGDSGILVDPGELAAAEPDPVARQEPGLLLHLVEGHQDHVAALTRLLDPYLLLGVAAVTPLSLDRHGIVLRLENHRDHRDVRLPFVEPLLDAEQLGHRIHTLLAASPRGGRRRTRATGGH